MVPCCNCGFGKPENSGPECCLIVFECGCYGRLQNALKDTPFHKPISPPLLNKFQRRATLYSLLAAKVQRRFHSVNFTMKVQNSRNSFQTSNFESQLLNLNFRTPVWGPQMNTSESEVSRPIRTRFETGLISRIRLVFIDSAAERSQASRTDELDAQAGEQNGFQNKFFAGNQKIFIRQRDFRKWQISRLDEFGFCVESVLANSQAHNRWDY